MKLKKTTKHGKGRASHYHVLAISEQTGQGITSYDNEHNHKILVVNNAMVILPAGKDSHDHQFVELQNKEKLSTKDDKELIEESRQLFAIAKEREAKNRKKAEKSEGFYSGEEQWEEKNKSKLTGENRAVLTINEIEPKIDLLSGYQRQNRTDVRFYPTEEGDSRGADIATVLFKNGWEFNEGAFHESQVFEDGMIVGRGNFNLYIDSDNNDEGDIRIEWYPWQSVYYGEHIRLDASDCNYVCKEKWFSKNELINRYPDKEDEISKVMKFYIDDAETTGDTHHVKPGKQYSTSENEVRDPLYNEEKINAVAKKTLRLIEIWIKEFRKIPVIYNPLENFYFNADKLPKEEIAMFKTIQDLQFKDKQSFVMNKRVTVGNILLDNMYSELFDDLPLIPVYAKYRDGNFWGKVEAMKDMQREVNKRHSQITDILSRATYGWFYDSETFDKADEEKFKKTGSMPFGMHKVRDIGRRPELQEGVKMPTELVALEQMSSEKMREISNINSELLGLSSNATTGIAQQEKKKQGLVGNEFLFDNLSLSKKRLAKRYIKLVQKIYTPERIMRILNNANSKAPIDIGGVPITEYIEEELLAFIKNIDFTKYDTTVGESNYNPATRSANFAQWMDLAAVRPEVPLQLLVDLSDLPEKDKAKEMLGQQMQMMQQKEQAKNETEIVKTQIAAESKRQGSTQ